MPETQEKGNSELVLQCISTRVKTVYSKRV